MLQRLKDIAAGKLEPTVFDKAFYSHELREAARYRIAGSPFGDPNPLWNDLHTATLKDYGITNEAFDLFHPNCR